MAVSGAKGTAKNSATPKVSLPASEASAEGSRRARHGSDAAGALFVGHLLTVWGIALSNGLLALAVITTWWRSGFPLGRPSAWNALRRRALAPYAAYAVLLVASVAMSYEPRVSVDELSEIFTLATFPLALLLVRGQGGARRIVDLLLVMMVALALHGVWQEFFTDRGPFHQRIQGLFSHYMTLSGVLVIGLCLLAGRLVLRLWQPGTERLNGERLAPGRLDGLRLRSVGLRYWFALGAIVGALYLTWTRHAWLASVLALALAIWFGARKLFPLYLAALLVGAVAIATLSPAGWQRLRSVVDLENPSNYDRVCMAYAGMTMLSERPLLGIGPLMVSERYATYSHPTAPRQDVMHLHNTFVQLAAERGVLSVLAYCWLMLSSLIAAISGYRREGRAGPSADLYLGSLIAIVVFNFSGLFEANWRDTEIQRLMLFLLAVPFCVGSPFAGDETDRAP